MQSKIDCSLIFIDSLRIWNKSLRIGFYWFFKPFQHERGQEADTSYPQVSSSSDLFKDQGRKGEAEMNDKKRLTAFIGIRVYPSWKRQMMEEAIERRKTLSQYIYDLIETESKGISKEDVKQGSEKEPVKIEDC